MKKQKIISLESLKEATSAFRVMCELTEGFKKGDVLLTVETPTRKRSTLQNGAMWKIPNKMLADAMTEQFGEIVTPDMAHEICKDRFKDVLLMYQIEKFFPNSNIPRPLSTANITTVGHMVYYKHQQRFGAEVFSIDIPDINQIDYTDENRR